MFLEEEEEGKSYFERIQKKFEGFNIQMNSMCSM